MNASCPIKPHLAILRQTVEANPNGMLIADENGDIIAANERLRDCINLDDANTGRMSSLTRFKAHLQNNTLDTDPIERVWSEIGQSTREPITDEIVVIRPYPRVLSLSVLPVTDGADRPVGTMWTFTDKDGKAHLESSSQQAQKLEAVGRLAGGVAHDFNNLLTVILGHTAMIAQRCQELEIEENRADVDSIENCTDTISQAAGRATELVKQLLGYSRRAQLRKEPADANDIVFEVCDILRDLLKDDIEMSIDLAQDLEHVKVDVTQIQQALMNICLNAIEAVDAVDADGGEISIYSRNLHLDDPERASAYHLEIGNYVVVSVKDTGHGMDEGLQEKIFDPFYSTKEQGQASGPGLGLATAMGIIQQHKGWVDCSSTPGKGTIFNIYLPVSDDITEDFAPMTIPQETFDTGTPRETMENDATILLVDDEPAVRLVPEHFLKRHGFTVITADDGMDALDVIAGRQSEIDLILSDLTMPRLCGKELCSELSKRGIEIPVILCSGFLPDWEEFEQETGSAAAAFIQKPYSLKQLLDTVETVLDQKAALPS